MTERTDSQVQRLLALAHDRSVAGRETLAAVVADLFHEKRGVLTDQERALMHDILRALIQDVERSVRAALATRLADEPDVPQDVVAALINDDISVAHPILVENAVVADLDLIEVIRYRSLQHQLAISMRRHISPAVCDALVQTGHVEVITSLLDNKGARIAADTMEQLVERSREEPALQPPLVQREDLPPELARRLCLWVSAALRQHLIAKFRIDEATLDTALASAADTAAQQMAESDAPPIPPAVAPTPAMLIQHLRKGEIAQFEAMFARMTQVRPTLIRRMVYEPGGESLAVLCVATNIAKPEFASIYLLSRKARPELSVVDAQTLARVLSFYDRIEPAAARRVADRWRHDAQNQETVGRTRK